MNTYIAFLRWIPTKLHKRLAEVRKEYVSSIRGEPGMMLFGVVLLSILAFVLTLMLCFAIFGQSAITMIIPIIVVCWMYLDYCYILINKLFQQFKKERQELFNTLKNAK